MRKTYGRRAALLACAVALALAATAGVAAVRGASGVGGARVRVFPGGRFPAALAMSPDGRTLYVADQDAPDAHGAVAALDLATGRLGHPVPVSGYPFALAITPDGRTMFTEDSGPTITPIDVADGTAQPAVHTGIDTSNIYPLLTSRDGRTLYIAGATRIRRYDITAHRFGTDIPADAPVAMLLSLDGKTLWYASGDSQVVAINLAAGAVTKRLPVKPDPQSLAMTPDGRTLYVAAGSPANDQVLPIETATGVVGTPIPLSHVPGSMVMAPDGRTLYVVETRTVSSDPAYPASTGWVTPITLATRSAGPSVKVGYGPSDIAITPDGNTLYIANTNSDTISVISLNS